MNNAVALDLQDKSAHISSLNKTPVSILQEYATKNRLTPHYVLIRNGISQNKISFQYILTLDSYETTGKGTSKKEAKHVAAINLLNQMIKDKPELLNTDFKNFEKHVVSPFENTIKVNAVGQLNDFCANNKLGYPEFNLVHQEGQSHAKMFTISCQVAKMIEVATHKTKKQAKHLAAMQMVKKLTSIDKSMTFECKAQVPDSFEVLEKVIMIKSSHVKKHAPMDQDMSKYHLLFKKTKWPNDDTLKEIIKQYNQDNTLELADPYAVLKQIVQECEMHLVEKFIDKESLVDKNLNFCTLHIDNVYPPVYGIGEDVNIEKAKTKASTDLLKNICILSK